MVLSIIKYSWGPQGRTFLYVKILFPVKKSLILERGARLGTDLYHFEFAAQAMPTQILIKIDWRSTNLTPSVSLAIFSERTLNKLEML